MRMSTGRRAPRTSLTTDAAMSPTSTAPATASRESASMVRSAGAGMVALGIVPWVRLPNMVTIVVPSFLVANGGTVVGTQQQGGCHVLPGLGGSANQGDPCRARRPLLARVSSRRGRLPFAWQPDGQAVRLPHVVAEELRPGGGGQQLRQLGELPDVDRRMIRVGEVRRPEEAVLADDRNHARERAFVGVARYPALALEVDARLLGQRYVPPERRGVDGVHALEPVADPTGAGLEHHDLQAGELLEHAELEERREGVADGVRCGDVDEEAE